MSIREEAENERQKLKNMSWKDRAWYVWEYYKFHLLAVILVIGVLSTIEIGRADSPLPQSAYKKILRENRGTKGLVKGNQSFDDRTYVRFAVF